MVARWGGLGSRYRLSIQVLGVRLPSAPLIYFDFARFALAFLVAGGGVFKSRLTASSKGIGAGRSRRLALGLSILLILSLACRLSVAAAARPIRKIPRADAKILLYRG